MHWNVKQYKNNDIQQNDTLGPKAWYLQQISKDETRVLAAESNANRWNKILIISFANTQTDNVMGKTIACERKQQLYTGHNNI